VRVVNMWKSNDMWRYPVDEVFDMFQDRLEKQKHLGKNKGEGR